MKHVSLIKMVIRFSILPKYFRISNIRKALNNRNPIKNETAGHIEEISLDHDRIIEQILPVRILNLSANFYQAFIFLKRINQNHNLKIYRDHKRKAKILNN